MSNKMNSGVKVSIPNNVRKTIQNIKEITGSHSEDEIYAMLKDCSMDPNETAQKLLLQDPFHEVRRKRDRKKENVVKESTETRWKPGMQGRGSRGGRGNYSSRHNSHEAGSNKNAPSGKESEINHVADDGVILPAPQDKKSKEITVVPSSCIVAEKSSTIPASGINESEVKILTAALGDLSASDSVLMPSQDSQLPVGTISLEVGSQQTPLEKVNEDFVEIESKTASVLDVGSSFMQGKMFQGDGPHNRPQQVIGPHKGMSNNSEFGQDSVEGEHEDEGNSYSSGKHRSYVWDYFDPLPVAPNGDKKAKCSACGQLYVTNASSGTSNLRRHIPKCFDIDEPGPAKKQRRAPLDQAMYREMLAISIIKHNYPFSYVEHEKTRKLHKFLHGDVKFITRNTAKADVLKIYERGKMIIKDKLEKVTGRICLTSDLWSSITTDGFMTLTAHYVDENWNLRKKVINFRVIPPPHSGSILAEHLINFLADWGIEKKVFTITLDNAKYNDILVYRLKDHLRLNNALVCDGDFTHVRCSAHVLNLIVQAGLKAIEGAIEKVRESVKYVRASAARKYKFAECIQILSLQCGKHVRQDIVTRWNSTYLMLDCALAYRRAYTRLALVDSIFKTSPSEKEWARVKIITRLLKPFYEITTLFSGSSYPTSNLYFHHVWRIQLYIEEEMCNADQVISDMAKDMKEKFDKYWKNYSMILSFAAILDPRYKVKLVEYCFSKLNMTFEEREMKLKCIVDGMHKLYDTEYNIQSKTMHDSLIPESSNVGGNTLDEMDGFDTFQSQFKVVDNEKSQLTLYLEEQSVDRKVELDVLQYWKENQVRYPKLAIMARDILSIPITTVASESSFSIGGRVLSKYRTSLLSSNVEALLCTRDWLFDLKDENENEMDEDLVEDIEALIPTFGNF